MVRRVLEESAAEGLPGGGGLAELHMGGMCRPIALRLPGAPIPAHSLGPLFPLIGTPFPAPWYPLLVITSDGRGCLPIAHRLTVAEGWGADIPVAGHQHEPHLWLRAAWRV